jgi:hypothetical protein
MFKKNHIVFLVNKFFLVFALLIAVEKVFAQPVTEFPDTKNHWAYQTIEWAVKNGIVVGYPDGTFRPDNTVTEAEFLKMLVMMYKPDGVVKESNAAQWANSYYAFAFKMNYPVKGTKNIVARNAYINRGEVADLVVGTQGVNFVGKDAVQYLIGKGLASGKEASKTIAGFDMNGLLTRAEAVQFLKNIRDFGGKTILPRPTTPTDKGSLPLLPEEANYERKHQEIAKNPEKLKDVNTLINFVRSLNGFTPFERTLRVGSYNDVLLGTGGNTFGSREHQIRVAYSDVHGKKVTIEIVRLGNNESAFLKDFLRVFYPQSYETVYNASLQASKQVTVGMVKNYDNRTTTIWSAGKGDLNIWVGVK